MYVTQMGEIALVNKSFRGFFLMIDLMRLSDKKYYSLYYNKTLRVRSKIMFETFCTYVLHSLNPQIWDHCQLLNIWWRSSSNCITHSASSSLSGPTTITGGIESITPMSTSPSSKRKANSSRTGSISTMCRTGCPFGSSGRTTIARYIFACQPVKRRLPVTWYSEPLLCLTLVRRLLTL